jgi:hypothetical protein
VLPSCTDAAPKPLSPMLYACPLMRAAMIIESPDESSACRAAELSYVCRRSQLM